MSMLVKIKTNQQEESKKWLIINNKKVKMKYMDSKGNITERIIHPYGLYTIVQETLLVVLSEVS